MKKAIVFVLLAIGASSCVKLGTNYYCQCTISYKAGGTGSYKGAENTKGNADQDCKDKITMEESNGNTASCDVKQDK